MSTLNALYVAPCPATVFNVSLVVRADVAKSATDYYTVVVSIRRVGEQFAETLGTWTGQTWLLAARTALVIYDDAAGMAMNEGDELLAETTKTGSPAALVNPIILRDVKEQRR